ncbi:MAG: MBOAT family protein [Flavobacteriales bacterium]|nr:MBOAT family protein [Flavobacteriales bacterium]
MLFNSIEFALFLPTVLLLYWVIPSRSNNFRNVLLLGASYLFYGWWDWRFLGLIAFSSFVDFIIGQRLSLTSNTRSRKLFLTISVVVNLGLLGFFKYFNFFLESLKDAFTLFGKELNSEHLAIVLPVGISFYTFQTLSYTIDVYKRKIVAENDIIKFFTFVSFFPQLVAGPIERASHLLPQFQAGKTFSYQFISEGFKQIVWGFFLKLVIADRAAIYVDSVYNNVYQHEGLTFIFATVLFAFQIYGDFAGYSLIAIGTAKMFGFDLMTNFSRPYLSFSVKEFWTRWHISLSTWFRDYLYIPLGGNRVPRPRMLLNLFVTFVISGLWHGANWTFVIWGALNGAYLVLEILLGIKASRNPFRILLTFGLINFSWIFFRAANLQEAGHIVSTIFTHPGSLFFSSESDVTAPIYAILSIGLLLLIELKREFLGNRFSITNHRNQWVRMAAFACIIFLILYLGVFDKGQFIYFQF